MVFIEQFEMIKMNYQRGLWSKEMLETLVGRGKLSVDDFEVLTGDLPEPLDLDSLKDERILESKDALETFLLENPLVWSDGNRYSATLEKQTLLASQLALYQAAVANGEVYSLYWNTSGDVNVLWEYKDLTDLAKAMGEYVRPFVSYQQMKEIEIKACADIAALKAVVIDYSSVSVA